MIFALRLILNKAFKSWTVWAGILISVLTAIPDVMAQLIDLVGQISPALAAQATALLLVVTRLRSILVPILKDLLGGKKPKDE
jgi:preprotein translocase subunit SecY